MPDCRESDLISAYIDHELAASEISTLELHLPGCRKCREDLRDLREVTALTGTVTPLRAPANLTAALLAQSTHARAETLEQRRIRLPVWVGGLAAAATVVVWVGVHEPAPAPAIPLVTLIAAHNRQVTGSFHDEIRAAAAYTAALKTSAESQAPS